MADRKLTRPNPEPNIWQCDCNSITFYVQDNGEICCAMCDTIQFGNPDHGQGAWARMPKPAEPADNPTTSVRAMDETFAFKRMAQRIKDGEFMIVAGIREDASIVVAAIDLEDTEENRTTIKDALSEAADLIKWWKT